MEGVERWLDVPGYPGYRVSDQGRVQSKRGRNGMPSAEWRDLKFVYEGHGYPQVRLYRAGEKPRWFGVHQVVLLAFVGPPPAGMLGRHVLRNDPYDNRLDNLAYGTQAQNVADKKAHGTHQAGDKHPRAKLTAEHVRRIRAATGSLAELVVEICAETGVSPMTVYSVRKGYTWKDPV